MRNRRAILVVAVFTLAAINVWRWWPAAPTGPKGLRAGAVSASHRIRAEDFNVRGAASASDGYAAPARDLFRPKPAVVSLPVKKGSVPPAPPQKTPEELAAEAARSELAQIKLVGVVFRGGKGQAYMVKGDQAYMVCAGDKVGERFTVESISEQSVQLKDSTSDVGGSIPVSGK